MGTLMFVEVLKAIGELAAEVAKEKLKSFVAAVEAASPKVAEAVDKVEDETERAVAHAQSLNDAIQAWALEHLGGTPYGDSLQEQLRKETGGLYDGA